MNATGWPTDAALARLLHDVERDAARRDARLSGGHPCDWITLWIGVAFLAALAAGAL